jgi:hypothetical protein
VVALAAWVPVGWPRGVVAIVAVATPWLAYVGCLAYVELGMLLFAAVAVGLLTTTLTSPREGGWRRILAAGICAGLAGGCKYTALVLVVVALAVSWLIVMRGGVAVRFRRGMLFALGAGVAFSPWLIRNTAFTGNPVYPFAYAWFGGAAWSAEQDAQWAEGHRPPAEARSVAGRLATVRSELIEHEMFNGLLWLLGVAGLVLARNRVAAMLAIWTVLMVVVWGTMTHMPGRFALPVVIPLSLLVGLGLAALWARERAVAASAVLLVLVVVAGVMNNVTLGRRWVAHERRWAGMGVPMRAVVGATKVMLEPEVSPLNGLVPRDGLAWLVGDARAYYLTPPVRYTVVFNRDPWLAYAREATPAEAVTWLRTQKVSHVVFSWAEIDRLRSTYGFPEWVTRSWAERLRAVGLRPVWVSEDVPRPGTVVYEVLPR